MEETVEISRIREENVLFQLERSYSTAEMRNKIIKSYSDGYLKKIGQKNAFMRFQKLAKSFALCNTEIKTMVEVGEYEEWVSTLKDF